MSKSTTRYIIDVAIILFLIFGFGVIIPPIAPVTPLGMQMIGILAGCIYGWVKGLLVWPSVLGVIATGFVTGMGVNKALSAAWGNDTVILIISSYFLCAGLAKTNMLDTITLFILQRKFARKSPWLLALAMFIAAFVGGALVGTMVTCILLWVLLGKLRDSMELDINNPYIHYIACGMAICAYCGYTIVPWNAMILITNGVMAAVNPSFVVNFMSYSMVGIILSIVTLPALVLVGKLVCPKIDVTIPDENSVANIIDLINRVEAGEVLEGSTSTSE